MKGRAPDPGLRLGETRARSWRAFVSARMVLIGHKSISHDRTMVLSWANTSRPKHLPVASSGNAVSWRASHWHVRPIQPHVPGCASVDAHSHIASGVAARHRPAVPPAGNRRSRGHAALRLERDEPPAAQSSSSRARAAQDANAPRLLWTRMGRASRPGRLDGANVRC